MTGTVAYILARKVALGAVSGIKDITLNGNQIVFQFNDGSTATMTIPIPSDGKDGADGKDGKPGQDGAPGADGKDGISIQDIKIDDNKHLICTLSDGTTIDAGELQCGCTDDNGGGILQAASKDDFPQPGKKDMLYLALDTNILYYWDNEYKVIVSDSSGLDLGLATEEDIDSLFDDEDLGDSDRFGLATKEDIDSLFGNEEDEDPDRMGLATKEDIDSLF